MLLRTLTLIDLSGATDTGAFFEAQIDGQEHVLTKHLPAIMQQALGSTPNPAELSAAWT